MANEINVFEMTNMALKNLYVEDAKKSVKESVKKTGRRPLRKEAAKQVPKIAKSKLKVESLGFMEEAEEDVFDFTPEDEVVVVIDPEMEEVPEGEEDAIAAAEELVGDTICKCSICGANYICDCESTIEEDIDGEIETVVEDGVCPVCGEDGAQIVVGEIVPTDETPIEDDEEVETETDVDVDIDDEFDIDVDEEEEVEEACKEGCDKKAKKESSDEKDVEDEDKMKAKREAMKNRRMALRRESSMRRKPAMRRESAVRRPMRSPVAERKISSKITGKQFRFDERALNRLFNKFVAENYSNVKSVRFTKGAVTNRTLTIEGIVTTVRGSKRPIKLVSENFNSANRIIKFKEVGPFTESIKTPANRASFIVECTKVNGVVTPKTLKYSFVALDAKPGMKESKARTNRQAMKESFRVSGIVK